MFSNVQSLEKDKSERNLCFLNKLFFSLCNYRLGFSHYCYGFNYNQRFSERNARAKTLLYIYIYIYIYIQCTYIYILYIVPNVQSLEKDKSERNRCFFNKLFFYFCKANILDLKHPLPLLCFDAIKRAHSFINSIDCGWLEWLFCNYTVLRWPFSWPC